MGTLTRQGSRAPLASRAAWYTMQSNFDQSELR